MAAFKKLLLMVAYFLFFSKFEANAEFIEETSNITLKCQAITDEQSLTVTYENGRTEKLADFTKANCTTYSAMDIHCNLINTDNGVFNVLNIAVSSLTRTIVLYSCDRSYNVYFYARPTNLTCGEPTLDLYSDNLLVTCNASKIYPQAGCSLYDVYSSSAEIDESVNVHLKPWGDDPLYFSAECELRMSIRNMTTGHHRLRILMYPVIQRLDYKNAGVNFTYTTDIAIAEPVAASAPGCPNGQHVKDGFIKAGTDATCDCLRTSSPYIVGRVNWYNGSSVLDLNETDPSISTLIVSYPGDFDKTYICKGMPLSANESVVFSPKFAFGPHQVFVSINETSINLCTAARVEIQFYCWVLRSDFMPEAFVTPFTNRPESSNISVLSHNSEVSINTTFIMKASTGGDYVVTCAYSNTVFTDLSAEATVHVTIREPPNGPPKFIINGGQPVREGIDSSWVNFTCYADGGYPAVKSLTIACLGKNTTMEGPSITVHRDITRKDNGSMCICTAEHESGCYTNKSASLIIKLHYNVDIKNFTANNATNLQVKRNEQVTLECTAESNPKPHMYMQYTNMNSQSPETINFTSEPIEIGTYIWQSNYTIDDVQCDSVNKYTCVAENFHYSINTQKSVRFFVKCPFQFKNSSTEKEVNEVSLEANAVIKAEIFGFPPPTHYQLMRGIKPSVVQNQFYKVNFTYADIPYGILRLTLYNIQKQNLTLYSLMVDNDMESAFLFNFLLIETPQACHWNDWILGGLIAIFIAGVCLCYILFKLLLNSNNRVARMLRRKLECFKILKTRCAECFDNIKTRCTGLQVRRCNSESLLHGEGLAETYQEYISDVENPLLQMPHVINH